VERYVVAALLDSPAQLGLSPSDVADGLAQWRASASTTGSGLLQVNLTIVAADVPETLTIAVQLLETSGRLLSIHVDLEDLQWSAHLGQSGHDDASWGTPDDYPQDGRHRMVTVQLAAKLLDIPRHQVLEGILCGDLPHQRGGRHRLLLPLDELPLPPAREHLGEHDSNTPSSEPIDEA
jgi:hypothetical protein